MAVACAVVVVVSAATVATAFTNAGHTVAVLSLGEAVAPGATITPGDLRVVDVHVPRSVSVIGAGGEEDVVGREAASRLPAGTLLAPGDIETAYAPPSGYGVVGVGLSPGGLPAGGVSPGQVVDVVATTAPGSPAPALASPADSSGTPGTVVVTAAPVEAVTTPATSSGTLTTVVSVMVPLADAPTLAELSAAGQAALVVVPAAP